MRVYSSSVSKSASQEVPKKYGQREAHRCKRGCAKDHCQDSQALHLVHHFPGNTRGFLTFSTLLTSIIPPLDKRVSAQQKIRATERRRGKKKGERQREKEGENKLEKTEKRRTIWKAIRPFQILPPFTTQPPLPLLLPPRLDGVSGGRRVPPRVPAPSTPNKLMGCTCRPPPPL